MLDYATLKTVHVTCAALSISGYVARGTLMLREAPVMQQRWIRIVPHVVDTALLVSAVALALLLRQYPLAQAWLSAKVLGVLAYIVVGAIGLRYGRTKRIRAFAFVCAILIFAYIVAVARTRSPLVGLL